MPTVALLDAALETAKRLGYAIRAECLGGGGGGGCELRGRKLFFLDLDLGPDDQLEKVLETLRRDPKSAALPMPHQLRWLLRMRKAA
jgi:hypothetical protein